MNIKRDIIRSALSSAAVGAVSVLLAACAAGTVRDPGVSRARAALTELQADPNLGSRAPVAMQDAQTAVQQAEQTQTDAAAAAHLAYIAERRVQIARLLAQTSLDDDKRKSLTEQNAQIQLDGRTREADAAQRRNADLQMQTELAHRQNSDLQLQANAANRKNEALQAQLETLQAKKTDRGMVMTLGDVLFSTGRSDLKAGSFVHLDQLVTFLGQAPDRSVRIEGHTDNKGSSQLNQALSQKRAESVATYLTDHGIASNRVTALGEGYASPVADNNTEAGRQANRRVEVIIVGAAQ